jgi:hypothetical protein
MPKQYQLHNQQYSAHWADGREDGGEDAGRTWPGVGGGGAGSAFCAAARGWRGGPGPSRSAHGLGSPVAAP